MAEILDRVAPALAERYVIERELGVGGMATVFLAQDLKHDRQVAIKIMKPELAAALGKARFIREIQIAARLHHPHVLALFDSGEAGGFLYYVMPFVNGESLRARIQREQRLDPLEALRLTLEVADALSYAHRQGVVHRDIKPENILLSEGHALVADFGIAKAISNAAGTHLTRTGFPVGTLGYMSPEQAAGGSDLDERTDVYSLACVHYEAVVGEPLGRWLRDECVNVGRFLDAPPAHRRRLDQLRGAAEQALVRALALRREDRFATPDEFVRALNAPDKGVQRYSPAAVKEIVDRAAVIQAERPTTEGAMSLGGIQQLAAEVGIPPDHVRQAARSVTRSAPKKGSWFLGSPTSLSFERIIDGEVSEDEFPVMVEEIRTTIGNIGHVSTLGRSVAWRTATTAGHPGREIHITITPRAGRTRIRIEERMMDLAGGLFGGIMGGAGGAGTIVSMAIGLAKLGSVALALGGAVVFAGGSWGLARSIFIVSARKRRDQLTGLIDRLAGHVEDTVGG